MSEFKKLNNNSHLSIMTECPICKAKTIDLNVIEEGTDGYLLHSKCKKCNNSIIMFAMNNDIGLNVIGMNTDLSMDEIVKFRSFSTPIEIDEVLKMRAVGEMDKFIKAVIA